MITRSRIRAILTLTLSTAATLVVLAPSARADVTIEQKTSMTVGGINIDVDSVERTTPDKQRTDSTTSCQGFLSLFCHDMEGGRIVRLDKQVEWQLQPKKKLYSERPFPTAEQRAEAQKQLEATMEEMKNCPMPQSQGASQTSAPDTSHCQMSASAVNVNATGEHATILGHDASKTSVVMSQTCTDTQTGDVCEIDYGFETWLTADEIAGGTERREFGKRYLQAQGLDPSNPQVQRSVQQFMAPYAGQLMQLQGKASALKGYPLRTIFYMAFGGPHCGKAKQAAQQQASSGSGSNAFSMHSIASKALAGGFAGLFHRGAAAIDTSSAGGAAASGAANAAADPAANAAANAATPQSSAGSAAAAAPAAAPVPAPGALVRIVSLTTETTSIDTSTIPSEQFEIPADWKLQPQKQVTNSAPKCPSPGK